MPSSPAELTKQEIKTLLAVFDTIIPSIPLEALLQGAPHLAKEGIDSEILKQYASEKPSELPKLREELDTLVPYVVKPFQMSELKLVLSLLR